jgi:hypothetical protein
MDVLSFIFQDFWHWLGAAILLSIIFGSLARLFTVIFIRRPIIRKIEEKRGGQ